MGMSRLGGALAAALGAALGASGACADELTLICHVRESRGSSHHEFKRKLDIDFAKRTVGFYDDIGHGWAFKREGPFVTADADHIRLDAGEGKESFVDRRTGEYEFHNRADGVTIKGHCDKTAPDRPRF
jgi:hypothetical protein